MKQAWMHSFSSPSAHPERPLTGPYMKEINFMSVDGAPAIDHAGGSVVAPLSEYLLLLKAFTATGLSVKRP